MKITRALLGFMILSVILTVTSFGLAASPEALVGSQNIGCGYNIFDRYASPDSIIMGKIFDLSKMKTINYAGHHYSIPQNVEFLPLGTSNFQMISGESLTSYLSKLSTRSNLAGDYSFYSGSISADFAKSESTTKAYRYIKSYSMIHKYKLQMPPKGSATLLGLLDKTFAHKLETTTDFNQLFEDYGTHFLWSTIVGARVESNYRIERNSKTESINFEACVKADYDNRIVKGSASNDTKLSADMKSFYENTMNKVNVIGGKVTEGKNILETGEYQNWLDSVDKNTDLNICDFDQYSLVPIWELARSESRKNALKAAYAKYATGKKVAMIDPVFKPSNLCISDIKVLTNKTGAVSTPQGYTQIDVDLNKGSGHDFIYLAVKLDFDDTVSKPITGLTAIYGKNATPPAGYIKIDADLNESVGGEFIYLCYTTKPGPPIRDIKVSLGKNTKSDPGYTYVTWSGTETTADMNKGAGGDFIWIEYTTQIQ